MRAPCLLAALANIVAAAAPAPGAGASCGDELHRERAQRAALETQLAELERRIAELDA